MDSEEIIPPQRGAASARDGWFFLIMSFGCACATVLLLVAAYYLKKQLPFAEGVMVFSMVLGSATLGTLSFAALKFTAGFKKGARSKSQIAGLIISSTIFALMLAMLLLPWMSRNAPLGAACVSFPAALLLAFLLILPIFAWRGARFWVIGIGASLALLCFISIATFIEVQLRYFQDRNSQCYWPAFIPNVARPAYGAVARSLSYKFESFAYGSGWYPLAMIKEDALSPTLRPWSGMAWNGWEKRDRAGMLEAALDLPPNSPTLATNVARERRAGFFIGKYATDEQIRQRMNGIYTSEMVEGIIWGLRDTRREREFVPETAACLEIYGIKLNESWTWEKLNTDLKFRDEFILKHLHSNSVTSQQIVSRLEQYMVVDMENELRETLLASDQSQLRLLALIDSEWKPVKKSQWQRVLQIAAAEIDVDHLERMAAATMLLKLGIIEANPSDFLNWSAPLPAHLEEQLRLVIEQARQKIEQMPEKE